MVLQFGNLAASQERNRIARELHDSLGHSLTALNIQLQTAAKLWQLDPERAAQFLQEAHRLAATAVNEVRYSVKTIRHSPEEQSLEGLITALVVSFERSTGVLPITQIDRVDGLPGEMITPIYRIIQEALNNICKYAQATQVQVQVMTTAQSLSLEIQDNGRGFNLDTTESGFGLLGMRERVALLRGQFQIDTDPGQGCHIRAIVPLNLGRPERRHPPIDPAFLDDVTRVFGQLMPVDAPPDRPSRDVAPYDDSLRHVLAADPLAAYSFVIHASDAQMLAASSLVLPAAQVQQIEVMLLDLIGPIAPILLQRILAQVQDAAELIEHLSCCLTPQQQQQFARLSAMLDLPGPRDKTNPMSATPPRSVMSGSVPLAQSVTMPLSRAEPSPSEFLSSATIDAAWLQRCRQELTRLIGPIAHFLIQDTLVHAPDLDTQAMIAILSKRISDPKAAQRFQDCMQSWLP